MSTYPFKTENNNGTCYLTFHIESNGNIESVPKDNHLWKFLEDNLIQSKKNKYNESSNVNYKNAKEAIMQINGYIRFEKSGFAPIKLRDIGILRNNVISYEIPLEMIIENTSLAGLQFPRTASSSNEVSFEKKSIESETARDVFDKCCMIFGLPNWSAWPNLYNIYEIITKFDSSLKPSTGTKRFTGAANDPISGITSRHQVREGTHPPTNPMAEEEAIAMCRAMFAAFIKKYDI